MWSIPFSIIQWIAVQFERHKFCGSSIENVLQGNTHTKHVALFSNLRLIFVYVVQFKSSLAKQFP